MKSQQVDFILKHLTISERDEFLREILETRLAGKDITEIILSWEATAEINSSPRSKQKIVNRCNKLKEFLSQSKHGQYQKA